jgi:L-lactate dehydrogenase (cytochrome)/(S)-mandelate dehydrogenase
MRRARRAINIAELRVLALRRLPHIIGDWVDGGSEDELAVRRNAEQFRRYRLVPRYMVDISGVDTSTTLFGRTYSCPFGIAPTGYPGIFWPKGDLMLAGAAATANIPVIMSGAATARVEDVAAVAPDHGWFQLYAAKDEAITVNKVERARDAGVGALVVTVDVPAEPKRERDLRNGFTVPQKMTPSIILDGVLHPAWTIRYLASGGFPAMANWAPYAPMGANARAIAEFAGDKFHGALSWELIERLRALWPRTLILKGLMAPEDARRARLAGVDGIIVSNHGGRQGDRLPAPLEVLPAMLEAAPEVVMMIDGGIRRGADILTALALGARFVFTGRATLFGLAAGGRPGVDRAIAILKDEMEVTMRQIGRVRIEDLTREAVIEADRGERP